MEQRLFRFFALAIIPFVLILGVIAIIWLRDSNQIMYLSSAWPNSSPITFGIQAMISFTATFVVITAQFLAKFSLAPVKTLLTELNNLASKREFDSPKRSGIQEIDATLLSLFQFAADAQQRLSAERTLAADVSHQLRSPLSALSLRLEQIGLNTEDTQVQEDASAALSQVDRLVRLVEGLLTTWRSTSERELDDINISELLKNVNSRWETRLAVESRTIELFCEPNLIALGTPEIQELVLSVLIENSLQHGAGTIRISARHNQSWILIEVSDEGKGITADAESLLMLQGTTTGGTGLGLAWAKTQVAIDGGRLELRHLKPAVFGIFLMSASK